MKYQPKHPKEKFTRLPKTPMNIFKTLYYQVHRRIPNSTVTVNGIKFISKPYRALERAYITGTYEPYDIAYMKWLSPKNPIVIDVGANVGFYSLVALKHLQAEKVVAFEPSLREYTVLKRNVTLNGYKFDKFISFDIALSDRSGIEVLNVAKERFCGANSIANYYYQDTPQNYTERIETQRLDSILSTYPQERVDIIKIDVEGYELKVLRGAVRTLENYKPILIVEYPNQEIENYLLSLGYIDISLPETQNSFYIKDPERWMNLSV